MKYSPTQNLVYDPAIHGSTIPADALDISDELFAEVVVNRPPGKRLAPGPLGLPHLVDMPALTAHQQILRQIIDLERTVTDRRIREAVLGIDSGWLAGINAQIDTLRASLQ